MDIEPLALDDDARLRECHDAFVRSQLFGRESMPHLSWDDFRVGVRTPTPGTGLEVLVGRVDGALVATGVVSYGLSDNRDKAEVSVDVDPPARRRGHGRAMADAVCARASELGRPLLLTSVRVPGLPAPGTTADPHPYLAFALGLGFTEYGRDVLRALALPVAEDVLAATESETFEPLERSGYRLETHVGAIPTDRLDSYVALRNRLMVDAPTGAVEFEERRQTTHEAARGRALAAEAGRTLVDTLAVTPGGEVVAYTSLSVPTGDRPTPDAGQGGTYVHRDHRGHRLGLAVKVANLRAVQERFDHLRRVTTLNAETNAPMVAVNERLGFEPLETMVELSRH